MGGGNRVRRVSGTSVFGYANVFVESTDPKPLILLWRWNSVSDGNSEVLRREYYIDNFSANIDWLAETDGTIFAYQDNDGDGLLNAYDYTPGTETAIGGDDLTAGADGSREEPWPIFNIWQLQAIGGLLPLAAENLMMSDNANTARNLYGIDRMGGHYYLVADIEAAPTREWMHRIHGGGQFHVDSECRFRAACRRRRADRWDAFVGRFSAGAWTGAGG